MNVVLNLFFCIFNKLCLTFNCLTCLFNLILHNKTIRYYNIMFFSFTNTRKPMCSILLLSPSRHVRMYNSILNTFMEYRWHYRVQFTYARLQPIVIYYYSTTLQFCINVCILGVRFQFPTRKQSNMRARVSLNCAFNI